MLQPILLTSLLIGCLAAAAGAQAGPPVVDLSFPLGEHYRVGRYLPVRVTARNVSEATVLRIEAAGAVATELPLAAGSTDAIVPLLAVAPLKDLRWSAGGTSGTVAQPLRAADDGERLVGLTGSDPGDAGFAASLFPGKQIVNVWLDLADPLPGPAVAWGPLDAVLLDPVAAARVDERQLATLLAAGTAVGVRAASKPAGGWEWEQDGEWWVVHVDLAGPDDLIEPLAYEPVAAWNPGWPASARRRLVTVLVAFCIVALALTLWRSRFVTPAIIVTAILATWGIVGWRAGVPGLRTADGAIWVHNPSMAQRDFWSFHRGLAGANGGHIRHVFDVTRPVFASRRHFEQSGLVLDAGGGSASSPPYFRYPLERGRSIAFLHRRLDAGAPVPVPPDGSDSPLGRLAKRAYLRPDDRPLDTAMLRLPHALPHGYELWPTVVIDRTRAAPFTPAPSPAEAGEAPPR